MKKVILAIVMSLGMVGSANAFDPIISPLILYAAHGGLIFYSGTQADKKSDPRLFESVLVQRVNEPGYNFDLTQYEYDQSPGKYTIVK